MTATLAPGALVRAYPAIMRSMRASSAKADDDTDRSNASERRRSIGTPLVAVILSKAPATGAAGRRISGYLGSFALLRMTSLAVHSRIESRRRKVHALATHQIGRLTPPPKGTDP